MIIAEMNLWFKVGHHMDAVEKWGLGGLAEAAFLVFRPEPVAGLRPDTSGPPG